MSPSHLILLFALTSLSFSVVFADRYWPGEPDFATQTQITQTPEPTSQSNDFDLFADLVPSDPSPKPFYYPFQASALVFHDRLDSSLKWSLGNRSPPVPLAS